MKILPSPLQSISHPLLEEKNMQLFIKRDDLIHAEIMGNKWRKLKYNLEAMRQQKVQSLVTMGGAFSNHIVATAAAAQENNIKAVGIIRGNELHDESNPTLQFAKQKGMELRFVDRSTFKKWREEPHALTEKYPHHYFLPEGGTNGLAIKGCEEVIREISQDFDVIACPIGTGGTFAGLVSAANDQQQVIGMSSLKGDFIHQEMKKLLHSFHIKSTNYQVIDQYHFGGYGKTSPDLIEFINWFKEYFAIPLDPIYTGKSFFGVWNMIKTDKFEKNIRIVLLHTGGLQGILGFNRKNKNIIQ